MIRKHYILLGFLGIICFSSCNLSPSSESSLYKVMPVTFIDDLQLDGTVEAVRSKSHSCPEVWNVTVSYIVEEGSFVKAGDTICVLENKALVDEYESTLKNLEQNKADLNKNQASLALNYALLEAQVKTNEAQTAITNLDSLQLKYSSESQRKITELELQKARIEKAKLQKKLAALKKINASELRKYSLRIKQSENRVERISERLKLLVVVASQDGLALRGFSPMGTGKLKEGDMVYPGMTLVEIPDLSQMRVKIVAGESAYKRLSVGQKVDYTFDAMPGNRASGVISMKTPVGNPISKNSKVRFFDVLASVDSFQVNPGAGLSAKCRVTINELNDILVIPNVALFEEDTIRVVYVKQKGGYQRREVINGLHSPANSVIVTGLKAGEVVSLLKPRSNLVKSEQLLTNEVRDQYKNPNSDKNDTLKNSNNKQMISDKK